MGGLPGEPNPEVFSQSITALPEKMLPVQHIRTHSMSPVHGSPDIALGMMLVKKETGLLPGEELYI